MQMFPREWTVRGQLRIEQRANPARFRFVLSSRFRGYHESTHLLHAPYPQRPGRPSADHPGDPLCRGANAICFEREAAQDVLAGAPDRAGTLAKGVTMRFYAFGDVS